LLPGIEPIEAYLYIVSSQTTAADQKPYFRYSLSFPKSCPCGIV